MSDVYETICRFCDGRDRIVPDYHLMRTTQQCIRVNADKLYKTKGHALLALIDIRCYYAWVGEQEGALMMAPELPIGLDRIAPLKKVVERIDSRMSASVQG